MSEIKEICHTFYEELLEEGLKRLDICDGCDLPVNRHVRKVITTTGSNETSLNKSSNYGLDGLSLIFSKVKDQFPLWSKSIECITFLKHIDMTLKNLPSIPEKDYPRIFLFIVKDQSAKEWIMKNIIECDLNWNEAKKKFTSHFQRAEYKSQLMKKYYNCKQQKDESVQSYADRFLEICSELDRSDSDSIVMDHFIQGLHETIRMKYQDWLSSKRVDQDDVEYNIDSLQKLIRICIVYDVARVTSGTSTSITNSSTSNHDGEKKSNEKRNIVHYVEKIILMIQTIVDV